MLFEILHDKQLGPGNIRRHLCQTPLRSCDQQVSLCGNSTIIIALSTGHAYSTVDNLFEVSVLHRTYSRYHCSHDAAKKGLATSRAFSTKRTLFPTTLGNNRTTNSDKESKFRGSTPKGDNERIMHLELYL